MSARLRPGWNNSVDSDHRVVYAPRTPAIDKAVKRALGHGVCATCGRVVVVTKGGKFKHSGEPVVETS